jgi:uncharacterized membrane protein
MLEDIFISFVIYAFLGWLTEVIYAFYKHGEFVNRGFLHGPFCPIYGIGIVSVTTLLVNFKGNLVILYVLSIFITSILEYFTGYALEIFFHSTWWDYSNEKYNINGKICLKFSLLWGLACIIIVKVVDPFVSMLLYDFKIFLGYYENVFSSIIFLYFSTDIIVTLLSLYGFKSILQSFQSIQLKYTEEFTKLKENAQLNVEDIMKFKNEFRAKEEAIFNRITKNQRRLLYSFPNLTMKRNKLTLEIKKWLKERESEN